MSQDTCLHLAHIFKVIFTNPMARDLTQAWVLERLKDEELSPQPGVIWANLSPVAGVTCHCDQGSQRMG